MTDAHPPRKPRIALIGEFSAGKSTLSNLLLGARPLPEKVTATRLAPVWMSYGDTPAYRVLVDGSTEPVSLDRLESIPVAQTHVIRLFMECDILDLCDLIDFPGISDPNMSSEVWERMLPEVDAVIWCTHATQAWRQSEAAVWAMMPDALRDFSILLITRYDKLISDNDRRRVLQRVRLETDGQFAASFPISLVQALQAGDDYDKWDASGAGPFVTPSGRHDRKPGQGRGAHRPAALQYRQWHRDPRPRTRNDHAAPRTADAPSAVNRHR